MKKASLQFTLILACLLLCQASLQATSIILDRWGRDVTISGIRLLDWEGYIGNPETKYSITAPTGMNFPVTATITVPNAPQVYLYDTWIFPWDLSEPTVSGPTFTFTFFSPTDNFEIRIGVQPDRDFDDELYSLELSLDDGTNFQTVNVPIQVIDQDYVRPNEFTFFLDTSADTVYNFYADNPGAEPVMQQMLEDMAYFLTDQGADPVQAGATSTTLYFNGEDSSNVNVVGTNPISYTGFYLHSTAWSHGSDSNDVWSTGYNNNTQLTNSGFPLGIFSGGNVRPHPLGDRSWINTTGWGYNLSDEEWWTDGMLQNGPSPTGCPGGAATCDYYHVNFYSVMKHELLHALAFSPSIPVWDYYLSQPGQCLGDPDLMAYTGRCTPMFGAHAWDPVLHQRQWNQGIELIDKFELLVMQAVGWELRETTPFMDLEIDPAPLLNGNVATTYQDTVSALWGVPEYHYAITAGVLPPGLTMNSFSGAITGTPTTAGLYSFTVMVEDNGVDNTINPNGESQAFDILIEAPVGIEFGLSNGIVVYPNPATESVYVKIGDEDKEQLELVVYNLMGQAVRKVNNLQSQRVEIKRGELPTGTYLLKVLRHGQQIHSQQFVFRD